MAPERIVALAMVPGVALAFVLIAAMTMRMSKQQLEVVAANLCELAHEIARHRQGDGPHWIMLSHVEREMLRHGIAINGDDLQAAVALAVERCVLRVEGQPVHSIGAWRRDWQLDREPERFARR